MAKDSEAAKGAVNLSKGSAQKKPGPLGRFLRLLSRLAIILIVLVLLAAGAAILWLRSDSGLSLIAGAAAGLARGSGLEIGWDALSGPIPERLEISGLKMSDAHGTFLAAKKLELSLAPWDLLDKIINVKSLSADGLDLRRLPDLPPSKDGSGSFSPPSIGLTVKLSVENSRISPAVFLPPEASQAQSQEKAQEQAPIAGAAPDGRPTSNEVVASYDEAESPEAVAVETSPAGQEPREKPIALSDPYGPERGLAEVAADLEYRFGALSFDFDAKWMDRELTENELGGNFGGEIDFESVENLANSENPAGSPDSSASSPRFHGFSAKGSLKRGLNGAPDELTVAASAQDGPGGTLSLLMGQPDWPAWTLSVDGEGPLTSWLGRASLGLDDGAPESGLAKAKLSIKLPTGSIENDLVKRREGALELEAYGGPMAPIPEAVKTRLGEGLTLTADVVLNGSEISGELGLLTPNARLSVKSLTAETSEQSWRVSAIGSLAIDPAAVAPKAAEEPQASDSAPSPLPIKIGPPRNPPLSPAMEKTALARNENKPENAKPEGSKPGSADEERAEGSDNASPSEDGARKGSQATEGSQATKGSQEKSQEGAQGTAAEGAQAASGEGSKNPTRNDPQGGHQDDSQSGAEALPPLQGPQAGFLAADYVLSLSGEGTALSVEEMSLSGDGLELKGAGGLDGESAKAELNLKLSQGSKWLLLAGIPAREPQGAAEVKAVLAKSEEGAFDGRVDLDLEEIGVFSPWRGSLAGKIAANGPLDDLSLKASLRSPSLVGPNGRSFSGFSADLDLIAKDTQTAPVFAGDVSASLTDPDGGDITLKGALTVAPGPPLEISAKNLSLDADEGERVKLASPSLRVKASIPPEIEGGLSLAVNDWKTIGELTGLDISGEPARLELDVRPEGARASGEGSSGVSASGAASSSASSSISPASSPPIPPQASPPLSPLGRSSAVAKLELPRLAFEGNRLSDLKLSLSANNYQGDPFLNVDLSMGPGKAGPVEFGSGSIKASGRGEGGSFSASLSKPGGGELLSASGNIDLAGERALLSSLRAAPPQINETVVLTSPVSIGWRPLSFESLKLAAGGTTIEASLLDRPLRASVKIGDLDLKLLSELSESVPKGRVSLSANYEAGGQGDLDLKAALATPSGLEGLPPEIDIQATGKLEAGGRLLAGDISLAQAKGREIKLSYKLPMRPAGDWTAPDMGGPFQARLAWKGPVTPLWSLAGLADRRLTGSLDLDVAVEGPLDNLKPVAKIYLIDGAYDDLVLGVNLKGINLELTDRDQELRLVMEALDGKGGRLALEGAVKPFASPPSLDLRGQIKNLAPMNRDDADFACTALASVKGPLASPVISAKAIVAGAEINLDNARGGRASVKTLPIASELAPATGGPTLDVDVDIPRQVFIRGKGLDSEWAGHLTITGPAGRPLLSGILHPVRGTFELLSKQFVLSGGDIRFINSPGINPSLNLEMTRDTSDLLAMVKVSGSISNPELSLTSQPPHPSDEVLSQVLFGKNVSQLSRVEALQLANSLRVMAGFGGPIGMDIINNLRDTLGLSVLRVSDGGGSGRTNRYLGGNSFRDNLGLDNGESSEADDAATIEAGRYLSDNIYVGVEQNLGDNSTGVRVEVELTPSLTLQGLSTSNSSRVGLGWKRDY